jgi:SnoaL-like domain
VDPKLQAVIDRAEILDVLHQYVHACDRSDEPRLIDTYHPDARDNHGGYQGTGHAFAKVVCEGNRQRKTMSHLLGQSTIHLNGDKAGAETYFNATVARDDGGIRYLDMMGGRYIDKLERREDGKWRVQDRVCTCEWSFTMKVEHEWHKDGQFVCGTFDKTDPSYPVLGLR